MSDHCLAASLEDNISLGVFTESIDVVLEPGRIL